MPANKNAMTRYKILDDLLSNRYHCYSLDDLTEEVNARLSELDPDSNGVVRRTIENDLYYLEYQGPFMVDIERFTIESYNPEKQKSFAKRCLRYSDPSFSIFKKKMSEDEEYLLSEALSLLGQFDGLPNLDGLESLRLGLGLRKHQREIVSFSKNPLENTNLFGALFTAISQKQVVKLVYHLFDNQRTIKEIYFHPYILKEYNRRWYVLGLAEYDDKPLLFGLDRLNDVVPMPSHKYRLYEGQFDEWFDDIIGVTKYEALTVQRILFWVSDLSKNYVETKPLHESQIKYTGEREKEFRQQYSQFESGAFFSIDCIENYELIRELMSYGESLIVLSPEDIQIKIIDKISAMKKEYTKIRK